MKGGELELRLAGVEDIEKLLPPFRAYQEHYRSLTSAGEEQTRRFLTRLVETPNEGCVVLAESAGVILGFATAFVTVSGVIAERLLHLGDLYVIPAERRQGIGTRLIGEVSRQARLRGIGLVRWLSLATNTELNEWYASLGATGGDFKLYLLPTDREGQRSREDVATDA